MVPAVRLSMTLRWLAGGQVNDIYRMHKVSKSEFYKSLWVTVDAINTHPDFVMKFSFDPEVLKGIEAGFRAKVRLFSHIAGQVQSHAICSCMLLMVSARSPLAR